jgi:hypothetical protein
MSEEITATCFYCNKKYDNKDKFMACIGLHKNRFTEYKCVDCVPFKTFDKKDAFSKHILNIHSKSNENSLHSFRSPLPIAFADKTPPLQTAHTITDKNQLDINYISQPSKPVTAMNHSAQPKKQIYKEINEYFSDSFFESVKKTIFLGILEQKADPLLSESQLARSLKIYSDIHKSIMERVCKAFELCEFNSSDEAFEKEEAKAKFAKLGSIFEDYDTKFKQHKVFKTFEQFVNPETIILGTREDTMRKNNEHEIINKKETMEYISLTKTLTSLLNCDSIYKQIKEYKYEGEFEPLYYTSPFWQNPNSLRLVVFHDEFEPKNPLGDSKTLYKMDMFYFTILNLGRRNCSSLKNIFVLACVYSEDIKKYKIDVVLSKIVEELSILETEGNNRNQYIVKINKKFKSI